MVTHGNKGLLITSLLAPGFLVYIVALLSPLVLSLYLGLTEYTGISSPQWVGFANFVEILTDDPVFWIGLRNSVWLATVTVLVEHPIAIGMAVLMDKLEGAAETWYRAIFFLPSIIAVVVVARMWFNLFDPEFGLVNTLLGNIGLEFLENRWLGSPVVAPWVIIFIVVWRSLGWSFLLYYAGIKGIPKELYESGELDGATGLSAFRHITLPLLRPVIKVVVVFTVINAFKQMEVVYVTTAGGPAHSTQFLGHYLYQAAFQNFEFSYANAISVLFVIVCVLVAFFLDKLIKVETY
jgi:raffinose/stachyose/melibiose transport system permease protein